MEAPTRREPNNQTFQSAIGEITLGEDSPFTDTHAITGTPYPNFETQIPPEARLLGINMLLLICTAIAFGFISNRLRNSYRR